MFKRIKKWKRGIRPSFSHQDQKLFTSGQETPPTPLPHQIEERVHIRRTVNLYSAVCKEVGGSKWGYINAKGKFILPPVYEHAGEFQDNGLAIIGLRGLSGIIDLNGYFIVEPKYDSINPFSEGRATVINSHGSKVIDESGKEITAKAYSFIGDYKEGRALFADTDKQGNYLYGYLNKRGKEVLPLTYESASDFKDGKAVVKFKGGSYALISLTGKVLHTYPYPFVGDYSESLLAFQKKTGEKFGYMNEQGNIIIEPKFTGAQKFIGARAVVNISDDFKYGLIDKTGHYILKPNYNDLFNLGEERIAIGKAINPDKPFMGSLYAVADTNGHILTGFIYNSLTPFKKGAASATDDKSTFFIDKSGNRIQSLPTVSGSGELHFATSLIKGMIDLRLHYFDKKGEPVWKQNTFIKLNNIYEVHENKYKPNKDFLVYYPEIRGKWNKNILAKMNQFLKDLAGIKETHPHLQLESNYTGDFELPFFQNNLLVVEITGYNYPYGAANGMPVKKFAHIDLRTGEIYQLKDLFKPGSQYVKVISEMIGNQIKNDKKYSNVFPGSYKGIGVEQPFSLHENGLTIYFKPYEIAPYAAGFPAFMIPFEDLTPIIDQKSAFWKAFH